MTARPCPTWPRRCPGRCARPARSTRCARRGGWPTTSGPRCGAQPLTNYKHKHVGSVASLGLHKGVAQVYGVKVRGLPAWFMHRTYHLSRMPSLNRKIRVVVDWTLALFLKREVVSLGELHAPREPFTEVTPPATRSKRMPRREPCRRTSGLNQRVIFQVQVSAMGVPGPSSCSRVVRSAASLRHVGQRDAVGLPEGEVGAGPGPRCVVGDRGHRRRSRRPRPAAARWAAGRCRSRTGRCGPYGPMKKPSGMPNAASAAAGQRIGSGVPRRGQRHRHDHAALGRALRARRRW